MRLRLWVRALAATLPVIAMAGAIAYNQSDVHASRVYARSVAAAIREGGDTRGLDAAWTCSKQHRYRVFYQGYFVCTIPDERDCDDHTIYMEFTGLVYRFHPDSLQRQLTMSCGAAFPGLSAVYPWRKGG